MALGESMATGNCRAASGTDQHANRSGDDHSANCAGAGERDRLNVAQIVHCGALDPSFLCHVIILWVAGVYDDGGNFQRRAVRKDDVVGTQTDG